MMPLFASTLIFSGFLALSLSMSRHCRQVLNRSLSPKANLWLRLLGWASLGAALMVCIAYSGWATGVLLWLGLLSAVGLINILWLTYR